MFYPLQTNSYQVVIVTDGVESYAVFTYKCGELNWSSILGSAAVGYSAGNNSFANHPLSQSSNVNSIACLNSPSPWSNVIYHLTQSMFDFSENFNAGLNYFYLVSHPHVVTNCLSPDFPVNGSVGLTVNLTSTTIGSTVEYSCASSYDLIGNSTRVCLPDGNWTGTPPFCKSMRNCMY